MHGCNSAARGLAEWGFNTLGAWSDEAVARSGTVPLAVTPILDLGMSYRCQSKALPIAPTEQEFPDIFDLGPSCPQPGARPLSTAMPGAMGSGLAWILLTANAIPQSRRRQCRTHRGARLTARPIFRLHEIQLCMAHTCALLGLIREMTYVEPPVYERKAKDEAAANRTWCNRTAFDRGCDAFAALTAKRYFAPSMAAIKAADANHLVLGCRFAYPPSLGVVEPRGAIVTSNRSIAMIAIPVRRSKSIPPTAAHA